MTESDHDKAWRQHQEEVETHLRDLLAQVGELCPRVCLDSDGWVPQCELHEGDCPLERTVVPEGAFLAEFVLVVDWLRPDMRRRALRIWTAPHQVRSHSIGLLEVARDEA